MTSLTKDLCLLTNVRVTDIPVGTIIEGDEEEEGGRFDERGTWFP